MLGSVAVHVVVLPDVADWTVVPSSTFPVSPSTSLVASYVFMNLLQFCQKTIYPLVTVPEFAQEASVFGGGVG